jgi:hypothetical protein
MKNLDLNYIDKDGIKVIWDKNNFSKHKKKHSYIELFFYQNILRETIKSPDKIYNTGKKGENILCGIYKGTGQFDGQNMRVCIKYSKIKGKRKIFSIGYIKSAYFTKTETEERLNELIWPRKIRKNYGRG